uniref:Uncharacterized protein n=1 Tax=Rhizophora mucronata TaxID=61149 RepID=A0A2P2NUJ8_RHIMU
MEYTVPFILGWLHMMIVVDLYVPPFMNFKRL